MNIALLITLCGVVVAIIALWSQILRSAFSMSVQLTIKLDEQFNSDSFRILRSKGAKGILKNQYNDAEEVFDFFETVGLLVRRHALDKEMVWCTFSHWIFNYWLVSSQYILSQQKDDPTVWAEFKQLHDVVMKVQKKKSGLPYSELVLTPEDIKQFLKDEVSCSSFKKMT
jgi:hypothetical protein